MRGAALVTLLLFAAVATARADAPSQYAAAAALYEEQRYPEAEAAFRALLEDEGPHPVVLLGLGNSAYRQGEWVDAIYAYEWGLRLRPGDPALAENLALARSHVIADTFDAGSEPAQRARAWLARVPGRITLLAALAAWTLGWVILALRQRGRLEGWTWLAVALVLTALPAFGHAAWQRQRLASKSEGVLRAAEVLVRSGPGEDYQTLYTLHAGTVLEVREQRAGWRRVALPNGAEGWVKGEELAVFGDLATLPSG